MMVHVKYTLLAGPTVMCSFRFEDVTDYAIDLLFVFGIVHKVTLSGIRHTQYVGTFPDSLNIDLPRLHSSMNRLR